MGSASSLHVSMWPMVGKSSHEDSADGASRSGDLCRFIDMLNQGPEFDRLFGQSGDNRVAGGNVDRRAAR